MSSEIPKHNIVRDWNKLQGTTHPSDLSYQIRRDVNSRYITIENSSPNRISIAITPYIVGETPNPLFTLLGGEIRHIGINSQGQNQQFIWLLDPKTKKPIGTTTALKRTANQFVLRDGLNGWFVQCFRRAVYSA